MSHITDSKQPGGHESDWLALLRWMGEIEMKQKVCRARCRFLLWRFIFAAGSIAECGKKLGSCHRIQLQFDEKLYKNAKNSERKIETKFQRTAHDDQFQRMQLSTYGAVWR